jgi:succinyl-CoA synthetase alpha subunit
MTNALKIEQARAVSCLRGTIMTGMTHDAEVAYNGTQILIKANCGSRKQALSEAQPIADKINEAMRLAASQIGSVYKDAKP